VKKFMRGLILSLVLTLVSVLFFCWQLMTKTCDGQNLSRSTSSHPIPECRFLPREGWNVLLDASPQSYADNMTGSAITPQYGIFTRMQAEDFSKPIAHMPIPAHPLMATGGNSMHNDAYESDVNPGKGPMGIHSQIFSHSDGFGGYGTLTFDSHGRMIAVYGNGRALRLEMLDADNLELQKTFPLPGRSWYFPLQGVMPWKYIGAGMYFYLDNQDRVVVPTTLNTVQIIKTPAFNDPNGKFELEHEYDLSQQVVKLPWPKLDSVAWIFPEWPKQNDTSTGIYYWYATIEGMVGVFNDKEFNEKDVDKNKNVVHTLKLKDEIIENSFAVGEEGFFVISDKAMYKMTRDDKDEIRIDWRKDYDPGPHQKPGLISRGSGSSVDLTGTPDDGLVIVTDNAEPRMHVEFYRRNNGEKVCSVPLFEAGKSATDLSVLSFTHADSAGNPNGEYSALIENNWGHHEFPYSEPVPGITRVDAIKQADGSYQCNTVWESQEKGIAGAKLSLGSGLLYMYTNDEQAARGWYFTAIDFATGKTVWRQHTGIGEGFNAWQGVLFLNPANGALYTTTIFGMVMMKDAPSSAAK